MPSTRCQGGETVEENSALPKEKCTTPPRPRLPLKQPNAEAHPNSPYASSGKTKRDNMT